MEPTQGGEDTLDEGFVTIVRAAKYLSVSRAFLYLAMERGEIPYSKFGRSRRIPVAELKRYGLRHLVSRERDGKE